MKKFGILILPTVLFFYASMTCVYTPSHLRVTSLAAEYKAEHGPGEPTVNTESEKVELKTDVSSQDDSIEVINYNIPLPDYIRGIYLTNNTSMSASRLKEFIGQAKKYNINTFVMDVQNKMVPKENVLMIKRAGIFPVARVVVFLGGLKTDKPSEKYLDKIIAIIDRAARQGFQEVQLDYIRYADEPRLQKLSLTYKYKVINSILERAQAKANERAIYLSADVFGRITLNKHDHIGQKLENFSKYIDTIYPMLYPSHYNGDPGRMSNPYKTVREGVRNSLARCGNTRVVAYIQGFGMKVKETGLSLSEYIRLQMKGVDDAGGHGWIIWNAKNSYSISYAALRKHDANKKSKDEREKSNDKS
ncbi:MAG: putative glycoside hydrolase [Leptospirales bacterium]